jgi:hypothetical protein
MNVVSVPDSGTQMEPLTLGEYQSILSVLRRDAMVRMQERQRIRYVQAAPYLQTYLFTVPRRSSDRNEEVETHLLDL